MAFTELLQEIAQATVYLTQHTHAHSPMPLPKKSNGQRDGASESESESEDQMWTIARDRIEEKIASLDLVCISTHPPRMSLI